MSNALHACLFGPRSHAGNGTRAAARAGQCCAYSCCITSTAVPVARQSPPQALLSRSNAPASFPCTHQPTMTAQVCAVTLCPLHAQVFVASAFVAVPCASLCMHFVCLRALFVRDSVLRICHASIALALHSRAAGKLSVHQAPWVCLAFLTVTPHFHIHTRST